MSRKKRDFSRPVTPDPKYSSEIVARIVNVLMVSGKKSVAEKAMYGVLEEIGKKAGSDPLEILERALSNVKPTVEVRSRRVGGANYQVPTEVRQERARSLAVRWLIAASNERPERGVVNRLSNEILDASSNKGIAVKKREDTHRMAEANKAFAHYKW